MIRKSEPLSMPEITEYLDKKNENEAELLSFVKKFTALSSKDAKDMKKKLEELDLMQLRDENIVKIIDVMPENAEELSKILSGVSVDDEETKKILEVVREFK